MAQYRCYSKRLLNPFSGTIQVLELERARATSTDGVYWRIQILSEIFQQPWSSLAIPANYDRYFVYGVWSKYGEMAKVPIHPTLYAEHVEQHAQDLITLLKTKLKQLPFTAKDSHECWLLDDHTLDPVVLFRTACPADEEYKNFPRHLRWAPCELNEGSFVSQAFEQRQQKSTLPVLARDVLNDLVFKRVGSKPIVIWIDRKTNTILNCNHSKLAITDIQAMNIPELLITQEWQTTDEQILVKDYINWMAPRLLTLHGINNMLR